MFKFDGGYHNAAPHEVEGMKKDGWVEAPQKEVVVETEANKEPKAKIDGRRKKFTRGL